MTIPSGNCPIGSPPSQDSRNNRGTSAQVGRFVGRHGQRQATGTDKSPNQPVANDGPIPASLLCNSGRDAPSGTEGGRAGLQTPEQRRRIGHPVGEAPLVI